MKLSKEQLKQVLVSLNPVEYSDSELQISCPECHERECFISYTEPRNPFGCFREKHCGVKGNIYTLKKYGISFGKDDKVTDATFKRKFLKVFSSQPEELILQSINMPLGYKRITQNDYLDSRGFIERDYNYWETGCVSIGFLKNYVIFPISLNGENKAYVARTFIKDFEPRYKNSISEFSSLIGGIDKFESCETVILCEGKFDIINITRLLDLYDCNDLRSVCTFGAKVSPNQINLLKSKGVKQVIVLFDGDVIKKIKPIAFELSLYFDTKIGILEGSKDIDAGNCNLEQLELALGNLYSPLDFNLDKIVKKKL